MTAFILNQRSSTMSQGAVFERQVSPAKRAQWEATQINFQKWRHQIDAVANHGLPYLSDVARTFWDAYYGIARRHAILEGRPDMRPLIVDDEVFETLSLRVTTNDGLDAVTALAERTSRWIAAARSIALALRLRKRHSAEPVLEYIFGLAEHVHGNLAAERIGFALDWINFLKRRGYCVEQVGHLKHQMHVPTSDYAPAMLYLRMVRGDVSIHIRLYLGVLSGAQ